MSGNAPAQPVIAPAIPWYRSPVVIAQVSSLVSGIVAIIPKSSAIAALGLTNPETVNTDVTLVFSIIAGVAQLVALIARTRSSIQPVTLTQVGADLHVNTLAVQASQGKTDPKG